MGDAYCQVCATGQTGIHQNNVTNSKANDSHASPTVGEFQVTCPSVPATAEGDVSATAALAPSTPPPTTISDHRDHKAARLRRFSQLIRRVRLRGGGKGSRVQKRNKRKKEKNAARKERKATKTLAI